MNTKTKSYKPEYSLPEHSADDAPKNRRLDVQLTVGNYALEDRVKKVFDLARSGGRELRVIFSS